MSTRLRQTKKRFNYFDGEAAMDAVVGGVVAHDFVDLTMDDAAVSWIMCVLWWRSLLLI